MYDEIQVRNMNNTLLIDHLQQVDNVNSTYTYIKFLMSQHSYKIAIQLTHITFQQQWHVYLYGRLCNSILSIMDCEFLSNKSILITIDNTCDRSNYSSSVEFINCKFTKNGKSDSFIRTKFINVTLINCIFNRTSTSLQSSGKLHDDNRITVAIKNTKFVDSIIPLRESLLKISHANLLLKGMVTFHNITNDDSIIVLEDDSTITTHGRIVFSNNSACHLISFDTNSNQYIKIKEPSIISIYNNQVQNYFTMFPCTKVLYPFCIFQYFSNRTLQQSKFSIIFHNNQNNSKRCYRCFLPVYVNCYWISQSAFNDMIPTDVNNWFIKYSNNSININNDKIKLCACNDQMKRDCS